MYGRKIDYRQHKIIKYDGTNLEEIKKFINNCCKHYDRKPHFYQWYDSVNKETIWLVNTPWHYTLFLYEGTYLVEAFDLYGKLDGFADYSSLEKLQEHYLIFED